MVGRTGFEPATSCSQSGALPNCATARIFRLLLRQYPYQPRRKNMPAYRAVRLPEDHPVFFDLITYLLMAKLLANWVVHLGFRLACSPIRLIFAFQASGFPVNFSACFFRPLRSAALMLPCPDRVPPSFRRKHFLHTRLPLPVEGNNSPHRKQVLSRPPLFIGPLRILRKDAYAVLQRPRSSRWSQPVTV